jgi:hypothetical protein
MTRTLLAIGAAAVALTAIPAGAREYSSVIKCSGYRNGQCVAWNRLTKEQARDINVGFVFPKNYTYSEFSTIPQTVVTQYQLNPDARYVTTDGYIYVVDPNTYAVTKVITVPGS